MIIAALNYYCVAGTYVFFAMFALTAFECAWHRRVPESWELLVIVVGSMIWPLTLYWCMKYFAEELGL